jgi:transposase
MTTSGTITMTMREVDRLRTIQAVVDGLLMTWQAAERLRLTTRQIRRLVARLREQGPGGLVSRRRSKPSNNRLDSAKADRALSIIRERYADFGPTLACEKLRECHGLMLSKETVRHLMTDAGLWIPRRQRPPKVTQRVHETLGCAEICRQTHPEHRRTPKHRPPISGIARPLRALAARRFAGAERVDVHEVIDHHQLLLSLPVGHSGFRYTAQSGELGQLD